MRFESGNLGDHRAVGLGVWEARCSFGPGYRVYFAKLGSTVVLLLVGGHKASQRSDIRRAQRYWSDYLEVRARGTSK
jgi:putative addiction module killer protein